MLTWNEIELMNVVLPEVGEVIKKVKQIMM